MQFLCCMGAVGGTLGLSVQPFPLFMQSWVLYKINCPCIKKRFFLPKLQAVVGLDLISYKAIRIAAPVAIAAGTQPP